MRIRKTQASLAWCYMRLLSLGHPSTWLELSVVDEMEDEDKENASASGMADADTSAV